MNAANGLVAPAATVDMSPSPAGQTSFIECAGIAHRYETRRDANTVALAHVDLKIAAGEFVCLLGPSGCGKTTLLNMLAGFIRPSEGEIRVGGQRVGGPAPDRGVVFQEYSLFPWLTLAGNVAFGLRMAGVPAAERKALATTHLAAVGLSAAARRYPFELSGGMKQRAAIARALATNPSILLMDEPFAALDAMTRNDLQMQILEIQHQTNKTIVFVTHNIAEAIFLASRIIVMSPNPGRIVDDLSLDDFPRPRRRISTRFNALYERLARAIGAEVCE